MAMATGTTLSKWTARARISPRECSGKRTRGFSRRSISSVTETASYMASSDISEGESEKTASDSKLNLTCMELATGKIRWSDPGYKTGVAIIEADGLLFVRSYQTLRLIAAEPDACHRLGEVKTHDFWKPTRNLTDFVSPVLAAGRLYI